MGYDPNGPAYMMADETTKIQKGEEVRLKLIGLRFEATEIVSIDLVVLCIIYVYSKENN